MVVDISTQRLARHRLTSILLLRLVRVVFRLNGVRG